MFETKSRRRSIGFAFVTDEWLADVSDPPSDSTEAIRHLAVSEVRRLEQVPERTTVYAAILGNMCGPVVVYKIRRDAPASAADFVSEFDEFIAAVDSSDLPEFLGSKHKELGELFGIEDLIDRVTGDRPDWINSWVEDVGGGELTPREPDHDQGRPVVQGSGRTPRKPGTDSERGVAGEKEAERLKKEWGIQTGPAARFGPYGGLGLVYDSGAFRTGWGSDDAQETESSVETGKANTTQAAAVAAAIVAFVAPYPPVKAMAGAFALAYAAASVYHTVKAHDAAVQEEKNKHTPNPDDPGSTKDSARAGGLHLLGEVVYGSGDHVHPRVHFASERDAGTSWGWTQFGAPRARPSFLPADSAMPSDSSDERPNIWLGAEPAGTNVSGDDYWIAGRMGWAWSRFGAPRARAYSTV